MITVGLFGTCGGSIWRNEFMKKYDELGIAYFNPQVDDWNPAFADVEAEHLVNDEIILFPVTSETAGLGSLAETGFSIMQAIRSNVNRSIVIMIEKDVNDILKKEKPDVAKESIRTRALVRAHMGKNPVNNVYIVSSLEEMLDVSIMLHKAHVYLDQVRRFIIEKK